MSAATLADDAVLAVAGREIEQLVAIRRLSGAEPERAVRREAILQVFARRARSCRRTC